MRGGRCEPRRFRGDVVVAGLEEREAVVACCPRGDVHFRGSSRLADPDRCARDGCAGGINNRTNHGRASEGLRGKGEGQNGDGREEEEHTGAEGSHVVLLNQKAGGAQRRWGDRSRFMSSRGANREQERLTAGRGTTQRMTAAQSGERVGGQAHVVSIPRSASSRRILRLCLPEASPIAIPCADAWNTGWSH